MPLEEQHGSVRARRGKGDARLAGMSRPSAYSTWMAVAVGVVLLLAAFLIAFLRVDLPYKQVLLLAGVAAMFAGIGSNAAVGVEWKKLGQTGAASGAAAIAILLAWTIGADPRPPPQRLSVTYYITFPDSQRRLPEDLTATVAVLSENQNEPQERGKVPISWSPGGAVRLTVTDVSPRDAVILRIHSPKENKSWTSALLAATETFMPVNEGN